MVVRIVRRWMDKSDFAATVLTNQADTGLADDLEMLAGELIDEEPVS